MFYEVTSHSGRGQLFNCLYKHFTINVECYTNIVFFGFASEALKLEL